MADESTTFGLATLGVIAGSAIMLAGVQQTHGEHLNPIILAGGVLILAAGGLLTLNVSNLDGPEGH